MTELEHRQEGENHEQAAKVWLESLYTFAPDESKNAQEWFALLQSIVTANNGIYQEVIREPKRTTPSAPLYKTNSFFKLFFPETREQLNKILLQPDIIDDSESAYSWRLAQLFVENRLFPAFQDMHTALEEFARLESQPNPNFSDRKSELQARYEPILLELARKIIELDTSHELSWNELVF